MKKPNKRRVWWVLLVLVCLMGGGAGYYHQQSKKNKPVSVQVEKVDRRSLTELVVANGRIFPVTQVKISPEVSGEIIALPVKEGQWVAKGDLLLRIKPDFYQASRRSAEASFQAAGAAAAQSMANLEKAEAELKRNEGLYQSKVISDSSYLEVLTTRNVARAAAEAARHQVDVARAALARAEEELSKTTIYSPIQGTVSRLNSQLGERVVGTAMMTGTEVMTVADLTVMEARVEVGEMDVVLIKPGLKTTLEVDAFRDHKFHGRVTEVANSSRGANVGSGSSGSGAAQQEATRFEVRIRVEDKAAFLPGMSVTAEIETRYRTNVLCVPIQSVTTRFPKDKEEGQKKDREEGGSGVEERGVGRRDGRKEGRKAVELVFAKQGEVVKSVPVKRGISDDTYVEIVEGLKGGEEVVTGGYKAISRELEDGAKVKVEKEVENSGKGTEVPRS